MKNIAHRGAKGHISENTISSFALALEMGCDAIELDVHLSTDGRLVVFHDDTLDRLTGASGSIESRDFESISKLKVDGLHDIPTLDEVLEFIAGRCLVNIELKTAKTADPTIQLLRELASAGADMKQYLVSSFDWPTLQYIREKSPEIPLGVLAFTDLDLAIGFAKTIKAETIHPYFHLLSAENVRQMQRDGFGVFTWTINEPEDLKRIASYGVDGIITDFPDRL